MTSLDDLSDDALLRAFEDGTLPPRGPSTIAITCARLGLLEQRPVLEALSVFTAGLRRLAAAAASPACTTRRSPGPTCCSSTSGGPRPAGGLARVRGPQSRPPGLEAVRAGSRATTARRRCGRRVRARPSCCPTARSQLEPDVFVEGG